MAKKRAGRANGSGTLELRGRTWRARWMVNGKVFTRSTGTGDKREAEKKLAEWIAPFAVKNDAERLANIAVKLEGRKAEIKRYEDSLPALSIKDAFDAYRALPKKHKRGKRKVTSEATLQMYESQYQRFVTWAKENAPDAIELRNVSEDMATRFMAHLKPIVSANTYNKYITLFSHLWDVLELKAKLTCNPWRGLDMEEEADSVRRPLTVEEIARTVAPLTGEMRLLFALGVFTGLRLGDCALMDWGSIDLVRGYIFVKPRKTKKTGATVNLPIRHELAALLMETPQSKRTGYLLPETASTYLRNSSLVSSRIQKAFADAGIETQDKSEGQRARVVVGFHSLRHTFVSMAGNAGVPLAVVQSLVGHGNPMMTNKYFHLNDAVLHSAVDALPSIDPTVDVPSSDEPQHNDKREELSAILDDMSIEELKHVREDIDKRIEQLCK